MIRISENQRLSLRNLLTFRGEVKKNEIPLLVKRMKETVESQGAEIIGEPVSAMFCVEKTWNGPVADAEIMLPIDGNLKMAKEFFLKERFHLEHAVKLEYRGALEGFSKACDEMSRYIRDREYTPITVGYTVMKEIEEVFDTVHTEVYIGVSPNVL